MEKDGDELSELIEEFDDEIENDEKDNKMIKDDE